MRVFRFGRRHALLFVLAACGTAPQAGAVPNPVVPNAADCGVMRYNGRYYLMGVHTDGAIWHSADLVHWEGPVHAFSMANDWATGPAGRDSAIHACDLNYVNGLFHLYWSVNYRELRQIGHAVADNPLGPYTEPVRAEPFDGRIDPALFIDDDGRCFFYTVKFTDGNVIWGQPMANPANLAGEPVELLSALPDTWELRDHKVNEAPWVLKRRGTYYLLYNADHTATEYGNYAIGCAVAHEPLAFRNESKYPRPVLTSLPDGSITNCGQASVVRGPNGFEWWAVYFAIYGGGPRSQAIDRVYFFDRELFVDGPTGPDTPGYHPPPHAPTFRDRFDTPGALAERWAVSGGDWAVAGGEARQTAAAGACRALVSAPAGTHYVVEASVRVIEPGAGVRAAKPGAGRAGIVAWFQDEANWARAGLDPASAAWWWETCRAGERQASRFVLPSDFRFDCYHTFRIVKNDATFEVLLGAHPAPGAHWFDTAFDAPGLPGVFTEDAAAAFQAVTYTRGWDEADDAIAGWEGVPGAADANGLELARTARAFKGDALDAYEFMTQLTAVPGGALAGTIGVFAVYVDDGTYLRAGLDTGAFVLRVSGRRAGRELPPRVAPVKPRTPQHPGVPPRSYHLRVVKLNDRVILFVDGRERMTWEGAWGPSRVGLVTDGMACRYNGITQFEIPD
ncbi:MAG: family 43 glycosylhydrolase [Candidatus Hydrogenedentes bacterium]|nr:family 43 glycosylhydrolase [Candidatus Hydrogenedentota bacterium]